MNCATNHALSVTQVYTLRFSDTYCCFRQFPTILDNFCGLFTVSGSSRLQMNVILTLFLIVCKCIKKNLKSDHIEKIWSIVQELHPYIADYGDSYPHCIYLAHLHIPLSNISCCCIRWNGASKNPERKCQKVREQCYISPLCTYFPSRPTNGQPLCKVFVLLWSRAKNSKRLLPGCLTLSIISQRQFNKSTDTYYREQWISLLQRSIQSVHVARDLHDKDGFIRGIYVSHKTSK